MQQLIDRYDLLLHPEGGYYREVYRSQQGVRSVAAEGERQAVTHIYFLLGQGQVSRFHKVRHDEIWNFYEGAPLRLLVSDGASIREQLLGPETAYAGFVPGGHFQAAVSTGAYSLVGCTVAPGFEFEDFAFLADEPEAAWLAAEMGPEYGRFL